MIELLDYVLDYDDNFWIINAINDHIWGYIVYSVNKDGTRYNNITKKYYKKNLGNGLKIIPNYKTIFKPREFYLKHKQDLSGVWKKYVESLNAIGIKDSSIGIFGSYLIGFDITKDVDFVIYGEENLNKYYQNNDYIKKCINATYITKEHMLHQYEKHKNNYSSETDLLEIISRNWSGVQIEHGVLSTPRFITDKTKIPNYTDDLKVINVEVIDGLTSACFPRYAKVLYNGEYYTMITPVWKYQSFAHRHDKIECLAYVDENSKTIFLPNNKCYIKYLNKSEIIN